MISRAAQLPRICLVCRLGMSQRAIASPIKYPPRLDGRPQRRLASNFSPRSKERIEALISGALDATESDSKSKRPTRKQRGHWKGKGRPRGKDEEELAEWEIEPIRDTKVAHVDGGGNHKASETLVENNILPETVREGDEITTLPSNPKTNPNAKTFRHDLVNRQSLGFDALGKPVEAIIIKNPNRLKRPSKPIPLSEDERAATGIPLDWQSVFPRQESDESDVSDEVWQNIEEIRPRDATVVRRVDFDKMVARLVDGFTQEQLVTYLNRGKWDDVWEGENSPGYPWILKQSPWVAAQPNQWGALKRKEQQAVMILSAKWKLEIQEHIEGLGRTVVWLQPTVFQLITSQYDYNSFQSHVHELTRTEYSRTLEWHYRTPQQ